MSDRQTATSERAKNRDPTRGTQLPTPCFVARFRDSCTDPGQAEENWCVTEGGRWEWQADGLCLRNSGSEWAALGCRSSGRDWMGGQVNFVIEVRISGSAEMAGLSFGPYKDFLAPMPSPGGARFLQLEIDAEAGCWAFRVDGQLMKRAWWDAAVNCLDDLLDGVPSFKARRANEVLFQELAARSLHASCHLSVVITCNRFLQRLRLALRHWCFQRIPSGELEVLVVNPQSPDGTHEHLAAVARAFPNVRIREVLTKRELALNKGRLINSALEVSRGDWIWLTDADCLFPLGAAAHFIRNVRPVRGKLYFGERKHLSATETDALLAGRTDSLVEFDELAVHATWRTPDSAPWGYTQILHREDFERVHYSERINHFAHSDQHFITNCRRSGIVPQKVEHLYCLHLDHPFAWFGTQMFL